MASSRATREMNEDSTPSAIAPPVSVKIEGEDECASVSTSDARENGAAARQARNSNLPAAEVIDVLRKEKAALKAKVQKLKDEVETLTKTCTTNQKLIRRALAGMDKARMFKDQVKAAAVPVWQVQLQYRDALDHDDQMSPHTELEYTFAESLKDVFEEDEWKQIEGRAKVQMEELNVPQDVDILDGYHEDGPLDLKEEDDDDEAGQDEDDEAKEEGDLGEGQGAEEENEEGIKKEDDEEDAEETVINAHEGIAEIEPDDDNQDEALYQNARNAEAQKVARSTQGPKEIKIQQERLRSLSIDPQAEIDAQLVTEQLAVHRASNSDTSTPTQSRGNITSMPKSAKRTASVMDEGVTNGNGSKTKLPRLGSAGEEIVDTFDNDANDLDDYNDDLTSSPSETAKPDPRPQKLTETQVDALFHVSRFQIKVLPPGTRSTAKSDGYLISDGLLLGTLTHKGKQEKLYVHWVDAKKLIMQYRTESDIPVGMEKVLHLITFVEPWKTFTGEGATTNTIMTMLRATAIHVFEKRDKRKILDAKTRLAHEKDLVCARKKLETGVSRIRDW